MECHALLTGLTGSTAVRGAMRISKAIYSSAKTLDLGHTRHLAGIVFRELDWVSSFRLSGQENRPFLLKTSTS